MNVGTADLVAQFNSLEIKGFENASGGGFLNPSITAELTPPSGTSVVPEPSTYALFATGLVGLFAVRRRRRSANLWVGPGGARAPRAPFGARRSLRRGHSPPDGIGAAVAVGR
jgi:hypothetical protein